MKLHLSILSKLIEIPTQDMRELRHVLDDLGLEVKDVEGEGLTTVFNIETLANRGDHLCAMGVARELSARYLSAITQPTVAASFQDRKGTLPVRRETPLCLRYALLELQLPAAMKLRPDISAVMRGNAEEKPKPAIVDLLNFVQLELGQPMHAFDRDKIDGEIIIDCLQKEEQIEALDGKSYRVPQGALVIRDRKKVVAVAGVIGCANSMVTEQTTRVLLESACFDPVHVRKAARAMGLSTDASYAFERGSDIEAVIPALRRVVHLAEGSAGAVKDQEGAHVVGFTFADGPALERRKIPFTIKEIRRQMNLPRLADVEITTRLKNLGFGVEVPGDNGEMRAIVPSWRAWDIRTQEDLVEEFARAHGLARVKQELPPLDYETPEPTALEHLQSRLEPVLIGQGFYEVMTRSYYSADVVALLQEVAKGKLPPHVEIKNALESSYSHLKVTNLVHLSQLLEQNHRRGLQGAKVFEVARLFSPAFSESQGYPFEREVVTLAVSGRWFEHEWRKAESLEQRVQLFRGVLDGLVRSIGYEPSISDGNHPLLHPGVQGCLKSGRMICGVFGLIHPVVRERLGIKQEVLYAELEVAVLGRLNAEREFVMPSDFPSVKRDITLRIPLREQVGRVVRFIEDTKLPHLAQVMTADDFRKENEDFRRTTFRLVFQAQERTLAHTEVDQSMSVLLSTLKERHSLELAE